MSMYTTKLRYICEIEYVKNNPNASSDDLENTWEVCKNVHKNIFNFDYPLIAELKDDFETRFLMHFYLKEIGQETVGVWKHYINEKLQIISETYNQLYKSVNMDFDILNPLHYTENEIINTKESIDSTGEHSVNTNTDENSESNNNRTQQGTTTSQDTGNSNTVHKDLRTPQGNLQSFLDGKYLSGATQDYGDSSANGTTTTNASDDTTITNDRKLETDESGTTKNNTERDNSVTRTKEIKGKSDNIPQSDLILKYRETVINLIEQLINEFEDNFMMVYDEFDSLSGVCNNYLLGGKYYG